MKTLVIYFSHAGENYMENGIKNIKIGNCEIVAFKIKTLINADLFKVEEENPYPVNYRECCNVAKDELLNNFRPRLKNYLNSIEKYEEVIVVGPVWWGHYPMPLFTQLEKLDFTGKKVKFIATHEGSELGSCSEDILKLCEGAKIYKGLAIRGHKAASCDDELKKYIGF